MTKKILQELKEQKKKFKKRMTAKILHNKNVQHFNS